MSKRFFAKLDFIYTAPAVLCCLALLCGFIPSIWCLDGTLFAYISVAIFLFSIGLHILILLRWHHYSDSAPLAYAIVQPCLHFVLLVLALAVGATSLCSPERRPLNEYLHLRGYDLEFKQADP